MEYTTKFKEFKCFKFHVVQHYGRKRVTMNVFAPTTDEAFNIVRSVGDKLYGADKRTRGECTLMETQ